MDETLEFCKAYFQSDFQLENGNYALIWTLKGQKKESYFLDDIGSVPLVTGHLIDRNVYFGVGASPGDYGKHARCKADQIAGIGGLWIDLDVLSGGGHKNTNLVPDFQAASAVLEKCAVPPSIVVNSGGGIQAYWLFDQFWYFDRNIRKEDLERQSAANLAANWTQYLRLLAAPYNVDATQDLARVMRLPGTFNCKLENKRPVTMLEFDPKRRYTPKGLGDLVTDYLMNFTAPAKKPKLELVGKVTEKEARKLKLVKADYPEFNGAGIPLASLEPDDFEIDLSQSEYNVKLAINKAFADNCLHINTRASASADLMTLAMEDSKFRRTWQHKRPDFTDQSNSVYDFALAALALAQDWTIQEVVNLIIAHRRKYEDQENDKLLRPDYFARTIARAANKNNLITLSASEETHAPEEKPPEAPGGRQEALKQLGLRLGGLDITRLGKVLGDDMRYFMECNGQRVNLGTGETLLNPNRFKVKVFEATNIIIPDYNKAQWSKLAPLISAAIENISPDPTETPGGFCRYWLAAYLAQEKPIEDIPEAIKSASPFTENSFVYFFLTSFQQFLAGYKVGLKSYSAALQSIGCFNEIKSITIAGRKTTRSVWRVPPEV